MSGQDNLEELKNLSDDVKVKRARMEAQSVIEHLDPECISGWNNLIRKLEVALENAKRMRKHLSSSL